MMLKKLYTLIFLVLLINLNGVNLLSNEVRIIKKINNQLITNIDIEIESAYLIALNDQYKELTKEKMLAYAEQSLIKEIIKKSELVKYFDLEEKQELVSEYIKKIYLDLGFKDKQEFTNYLLENNLKFEDVYNKINIELAWNELIYSKYRNRININEEKIKKQLKAKKINQITYNLSEIFFTAATKGDYEKKFNKIKNEIKKLGFDRAAFLHSESESKKDSGLIGWINENQLSDKFKNELKLLTVGQTTNPIIVPSGKIILKINKIKRNTVQESDLNNELKKTINFEKSKQLDSFSIIYFNKVKNRLLNEDK